MDINLILKRLSELFEKGEITNEGMVQIIELCGSYLNLKTRSDYARENNISYNGVKKFRTGKKIFGVNFIIDNS